MLRCCVLFAVLTLANVAAAIPVTWEAHGVVRSIVLGPDADSSTAGALTALGVEVGAPFSVSVSYDSDAMLYYQFGTGYALGIVDMHVDFSHWSLNGPVGPVSGAGVVAVNQVTELDELGNPLRSSFVVAGDFPDTTYSFPESPNRNVTVDWGFLTNDPYLFSSTSLPVDPPDLGALPPYHLDPTDTTTALGPVMYLTNDANYKVFDVAGEITSVTRVPEPGAAALALVALALASPKLRGI